MLAYWFVVACSLMLAACWVYGRGAKYGYRLGVEQGRKAADAEWALHLEHGAL